MSRLDLPYFPFSAAVRFFWRTRSGQAQEQSERGVTDQGSRSAVTGGKQLDGFLHTLTEYIESVGVSRDSIHIGSRAPTLPGYYRPSKIWDLVVEHEGVLRAAIELKSQVGPSFGNNFNNRAEEAIGNAVDLWTAYREGAFGMSPEPWIGYLFLLEDCPASRSPVGVMEPRFKVFDEFRGASYASRYEILCRRLVRERKYSAACFLASNPADAPSESNYSEPAEDLSARRFLTSLLAHIQVE